jgi:hypothetical protein
MKPFFTKLHDSCGVASLGDPLMRFVGALDAILALAGCLEAAWSLRDPEQSGEICSVEVEEK